MMKHLLVVLALIVCFVWSGCGLFQSRQQPQEITVVIQQPANQGGGSAATTPAQSTEQEPDT